MKDRLFGLSLALAYAALLLWAQFQTGFVRDEGIYFRTARSYFGWVEKFAQSPRDVLTQTSIDRTFKENHEHPALLKTLFGASHRLFHDKLAWLSASTALRLPGILISAWALMLLYQIGLSVHSRAAGVAAALAYAAMPRVFFHSQLACFDAALATMTLWATTAFSKALDRRIWAMLAAGMLFGLALAIKLNAFFLPPTLALWLLLARRDAGRRGLLALGALVAMGGLVFFMTWPWLWPAPFTRLQAYLGFHWSHPYYNTEYLGVNYNRPPLPISYPFVMTAFTTPVVTLALALGGVGLTFSRSKLRPHAWLWLISLLVPMAVIAHPRVPIFGGTKHWLAAMPFVALFAGLALAEVVTALSNRLRVLVIAAALAPGFVSALHAHPFGLSQYNVLAGGTPGAADLGLLRQFWGYPTRALLPWINATLPKRASVYWHDTNHDSLVMYQREGLLRRDIRDTGLEWPAVRASDYALVIHERHFTKYEGMIWNAYGTSRPERVLALDGVPLVTVYKRPKR